MLDKTFCVTSLLSKSLMQIEHLFAILSLHSCDNWIHTLLVSLWTHLISFVIELL